MQYIFQFTLQSVSIPANVALEDEKGENLLSAVLTYPREKVHSVESIVKLPLQPGNEYHMKDKAFSEKLQFKESIQGDSIIKMSLTLKQDARKVNQIIHEGIKAGIIAGTGMIPGGGGLSLLIGASKNIVGSILDLAKPKDKLTILGSTEYPINNDTPEGLLDLHLVVPKNIIRRHKTMVNGKETLVKKTINKGIGIAKVVVEIKKISRFQTFHWERV